MAGIVKGGFPIHGDIGNARTFPFPVRFEVVKGATTDEIVGEADRARALLPAFIDGARALEAGGVRAITTSCGFLSIVQEELAAAVSVPVVTSSLFLVPLVRLMVAGRPVGVVTAHSGALSDDHLSVCGIDPASVHVRGLEHAPCFNAAILGAARGGTPKLDVEGVTREVADLCAELQREVPGLGALVFECTNLQPYAETAQARTGLPVFGIYHVVRLLHDAARTPRFDSEI